MPGLKTENPACDFAIDPRELRQVLGAFITGVTVITTIDDAGKRYGLTANSFSSVSLDPPLILWSQSFTAPSYPVFRDAQRFAVNILAEDQVEISQRFATRSDDKFAGVATRVGLGGVPLIEGCAAYVECVRETAITGGDHAIFLGRVLRIEKTGRKSLAFGSGRYLMAQPHEYGRAPADLSEGSQAQLHAVRLASAVAGDLAADLNACVALSVWGSHGPTTIRWEQPVENTLSVHLPTGQVCRLLTSATGLAFAAHMSASVVQPMVEAELSEAKDVEVPFKSEQAVESTLAEIRAHRLARVLASDNYQQRYGTPINAICAPVFDAQGRIVLAITVVGSVNMLDPQWNSPACQQTLETAAAISRRLGFKS